MGAILKKIASWFEDEQNREVQSYLNKATDIYDLERRIKVLENK